MSKRLLFIKIILLFISLMEANAQEKIEPNESIPLEAEIIEGDTMPVIEMEDVYVYPKRYFSNFWQRWRYQRLIRNIKIVYPYAELARQKFEEMNQEYLALESEREKKKYLNNLEKELLDEFGGELRKLTISQGRLLLKLIDREIGSTSYKILKNYKGSFSAFFWQSLARLFGSNLKSHYDPQGEDRVIEHLIRMYEKGRL